MVEDEENVEQQLVLQAAPEAGILYKKEAQPSGELRFFFIAVLLE